MHAFFCFLIVCLSAGSYGLSDTHIVGGTDAATGKYPYMVSLRQYHMHFCGGSIISERFVLTAAHCLLKFNKPNGLKSLTVHYGTNLLNETGHFNTLDKLIIHEKFDLNLISNDIGLLRTSYNIKFTENIKPISFATTHVVRENESCVLTGWGRIKLEGKVPNSLQQLMLRVYPQDQCKDLFWRVSNKHICAFSQYGQGACHGDSGSPLVADGVQIGIASFVMPCAEGYPDVYTRVSSFKDWITTNMK